MAHRRWRSSAPDNLAPGNNAPRGDAPDSLAPGDNAPRGQAPDSKAPAGGRSLAEGLVVRLLGLFPATFRKRYGEEMADTFAERWRDARGQARVVRAALLVRTVANLIQAGVTERWESWRPAPARWAPQNVTQAEAVASSEGAMSRLMDDFRYGMRFLRRHPAFTAVVLITLGLGIGMNTAVFSVLYGALYAPLPYADADRVVQIGRTHPSIPGALLPLSPANFLDVRTQVTSLASFEGESQRSFVLSDGDQASRHGGAAVTAGFFDMLGVQPAQGRGFVLDDEVLGAEAVVVVSDAFWKTQLGANPDAVGSTIRLNDEPHTVVGVMPEEFTWSQQALWVPMRMTEEQRAVRSSNFIRMHGRLAPGADVARATSELAAVWAPLREAFPLGNEETDMAARTLRSLIAQARQTPLLILAGAAGFVLLIACANVANLMLVRAERRQREVGVRAALGAGRARLVRQFLAEGVLTSFLGGVIGVFIAWAGVRALIATFGDAVPRASAIGINAPVLAFSLAASVLTGILVGLAPALRGRPDFSTLREGARGGTARFTRMGKSLVVLEVALAIVLVTGAGLLLKSYARALGSDLGFDSEGLVTANYWFPSSRYQDNAQVQGFIDQVTTRLEARPEISGLAMASMVPIREYGSNFTEIGVDGRDATASFVETRSVSPGYFGIMDIALLRGRIFTEVEANDRAPVVVINRTLARQLFGDDDPTGWRLAAGNATPEIIGVVDDVRDFGPDRVPRPTMYFPSVLAANLMVRSAADLATVTNLLRSAARDADPGVVLIRVQTMDAILDQALSGRRFQLTLIGTFALTALVLACVGIYGVLSYSVERQTREIGVRMALGARAAAVATRVAWRGGKLAITGVVLGGVGAYALRETIASQLFNVESFDPLVYLGVGALLLGVAAIACLVPARRAAIIDPVRALHAE